MTEYPNQKRRWYVAAACVSCGEVNPFRHLGRPSPRGGKIDLAWWGPEREVACRKCGETHVYKVGLGPHDVRIHSLPYPPSRYGLES